MVHENPVARVNGAGVHPDLAAKRMGQAGTDQPVQFDPSFFGVILPPDHPMPKHKRHAALGPAQIGDF